MECPRCRAELPPVAPLLPRVWAGSAFRGSRATEVFCGQARRTGRPFALISSIMPRGAGERPQTYRIALTIALVGRCDRRDLRRHADRRAGRGLRHPDRLHRLHLRHEPLGGRTHPGHGGLAFALTGVLTIGFTILWTYLRGPVPFGTRPTRAGSVRRRPWDTFLLVAVCGADRRRGDPSGRARAAGQPAGVRRPDGRTDVRCRQRRLLFLLRHHRAALGVDDPGSGNPACGSR